MEPPRFFTDIFPEEDADLSWVPDGMDPYLSYRLAVRVGAYVKFTDDGGREYCEACNIPKILDRDSTNWNDFLLDIGAEIKLGSKHKLRVTYWNKMSRSYEEITSDQKFLHAIDMYWEIRRLSVQVCVMKINDSDSVHDIGRQQSMPCALQGSVDPIPNQIIEQPSPVTRSMSRRLLEVEPATPTRAITPVQTPSPMTRGRKRMLELEGFIEPVACASLSPLPLSEKGKTKKLKVVRSKKT